MRRMSALSIFSQNIYLDIYQVPHFERTKIRNGIGMRDNRDHHLIVGEMSDGEGNAFDRNGALWNYIFFEARRERDGELPVVCIWLAVEMHDLANAIHMPLDDVAAEWSTGACGKFQVDRRSWMETCQCGAFDRFG